MTGVGINKEHPNDNKQKPVILNLVQRGHLIPFVFDTDLKADSRVEGFVVKVREGSVRISGMMAFH